MKKENLEYQASEISRILDSGIEILPNSPIHIALKKALAMRIVSNTLMVKNWAESREATARVREQIAIERFIEVYYDGEDDLTFEDVNKRLRLH